MFVKQLFIADFDENLFHTFVPPPNGLSVEDAYTKAIWHMWGERGVRTFWRCGGLGNRAPSELIDLMLKINSDLGKHPERSLNFVGNQFGGASASSIFTEVLIKKKLEILMSQIQRFPDGTMWPGPTKGALDFLRWVSEQPHLGLAIISSGHEEFIRKTFEVAGVPQPDFMVTEDQIRYRKYPKDIRDRVKPAPFPLALVHQWWLRKNLYGPSYHDGNFNNIASQERRRFVYTGDGTKDLHMALKGEVTFGMFTENSQGLEPEIYEASFLFNNWKDIVVVLAKNRSRLESGVPIGDILVREAGGRPMEGLRRRL